MARGRSFEVSHLIWGIPLYIGMITSLHSAIRVVQNSLLYSMSGWERDQSQQISVIALIIPP
jgi:hypothetical protein